MSIQNMAFRALLGATLLLGPISLTIPVFAAESGIEQYVGDEPAGFATPEEAVASFKAALDADNSQDLARLLGLDAAKLKGFAGIAERMEEIRTASDTLLSLREEGDHRTLYLGTQVWPFPFPLRKAEDGRWSFDTYAGLEEIINRRVGENELQAIATAQAFVDAERDYAAADRDGDGVLEFAQKLVSEEGKTDGLYWPIEQGDGDSPAGPFVSQGALDKAKAGDGYFGYRFRILHSQGPAISGGAYDYVINGNMIAGFALIAWPVKYAETGVHTFAVNQAGIVYETDLGEDTETLVAKIAGFNPDKSWDIVSD